MTSSTNRGGASSDDGMKVGDVFTSASIAVLASACRPSARRQSALYCCASTLSSEVDDFKRLVVFGGGVKRLVIDLRTPALRMSWRGRESGSGSRRRHGSQRSFFIIAISCRLRCEVSP